MTLFTIPSLSRIGPSFSRVGPIAVLAAGLALGAAGTVSAQDAGEQDNGKNEVIARVNGKDITERDYRMALKDIRDTLPQMSKAERRDYVISYLTDLQIVADAAQKAGFASEADIARRLEYMRKRALMELYLDDAGQKAATEEEAKKLFEQVIADIPPEPRVRARHILVEDEDAAKAIKADLDDGKDFAEIARNKSEDPGSGAEGGDLGWFTKEQMVPEFAEAAFALDVGEVSEPVKSDFGWHVIKVEDKRDKPGYDEVEDRLYEMLARQEQRDIILGLREAAEVERLDKPAAEADAPAATDGDATGDAESEASE